MWNWFYFSRNLSQNLVGVHGDVIQVCQSDALIVSTPSRGRENRKSCQLIFNQILANWNILHFNCISLDNQTNQEMKAKNLKVFRPKFLCTFGACRTEIKDDNINEENDSRLASQEVNNENVAFVQSLIWIQHRTHSPSRWPFCRTGHLKCKSRLVMFYCDFSGFNSSFRSGWQEITAFCYHFIMSNLVVEHRINLAYACPNHFRTVFVCNLVDFGVKRGRQFPLQPETVPTFEMNNFSMIFMQIIVNQLCLFRKVFWQSWKREAKRKKNFVNTFFWIENCLHIYRRIVYQSVFRGLVCALALKLCTR